MYSSYCEVNSTVLISPWQKGFDILCALDVMNNTSFLEKLKFTISDKRVHYYLYNWMCPLMSPDKVLNKVISTLVKREYCLSVHSKGFYTLLQDGAWSGEHLGNCQSSSHNGVWVGDKVYILYTQINWAIWENVTFKKLLVWLVLRNSRKQEISCLGLSALFNCQLAFSPAFKVYDPFWSA